MTSVTYFLFKDQISTLSTKHSSAKNVYLFLNWELAYTLAVISEIANLDPGVSLWQLPVFLKINESKFWLVTYAKQWKKG